jgi:thiamine biosynthesis lipoprotein
MNTRVQVQLYADGDDRALEEVQRMFDKAERALTRFDPSSELSQLNRVAGRPCRVGSLLFDALEMAVWAAQATQGLFDPTLLHVMEAIGYDRSFERIEQDQPMAAALPRPHPLPIRLSQPRRKRYEDIVLNRMRREITLPADVRIDLGGIGKGWTVDRAADWLAYRGAFMINAGGDLYAYGAPPGQEGWSIGIVDPWQPDQDILRVRVHQRAVATSTTSRRRWQRGGRQMHHLIDPRSGQPAETDVISATVIAHRVALAEVYAKTALILGAEAGRRWLDSLPETEGLLIRNDGQLVYTDGFSAYLETTNDNSNAIQSVATASRRHTITRRRGGSRHTGRPAPLRVAAQQRAAH